MGKIDNSTKRFTQAKKWIDKWFRNLKSEHKLFWIYLFDNCDHAGIWIVDFELAEILMKCKINGKEIKKVFKGKFQSLENGKKWFIQEFLRIQYHVLDEKSTYPARTSAIKILKEADLWDSLPEDLKKTYPSPTDKDTDTDTVKDKDNYYCNEYDNIIKDDNCFKILCLELKRRDLCKKDFEKCKEFYSEIIAEVSKDEFCEDDKDLKNPEIIEKFTSILNKKLSEVAEQIPF